jgi:hypothetical protein
LCSLQAGHARVDDAQKKPHIAKSTSGSSDHRSCQTPPFIHPSHHTCQSDLGQQHQHQQQQQQHRIVKHSLVTTMDSMRSLNTSLPRASPRRTTPQQPPEELLSAFKAAALSVTNLYKNAASEQARARAAGYQDALDDLLSFLDKENLGVGDGEGWRVRQWATERFDGVLSGSRDSDDEEEEQEEQARSSSPDNVRKPTASAATQELPLQPQQQPGPTTINTEIPSQQQQPPQPQSHRPDLAGHQADSFTFRSPLAYPPSHQDREIDMEYTNTTAVDPSSTSIHNNNSNNNNNNSVRLDSHQRRRNTHHRSSNNTNTNRIPSVNLGSLGSGAGSKRKNLGDFFDISGLSFGNPKDGTDRGGKRGRHV